MGELHVLWVYAQVFLARTRQDERGMTTLEKVVLTAISVAMALAAGAVIYNLAVNKAKGIDATFTP